MTVTTGAALEIPFLCGSAVVGQGNLPEVQLLMSFNDLNGEPNWQDRTPDLRDWSVSRGRESEFTEMDAGTATVTMDNRARRYDPTSDSTIHPKNLLWLRAFFSGNVYDLFYGYTDSYDQQWPAPGQSDAVCVVTATDELKNLSRTKLPTMNPPVDTYSDVVQFDTPTGYWQLNDPVDSLEYAAVVGDSLLPTGGGFAPAVDSPILGDNGGVTGVTSYSLGTGGRFVAATADEGSMGDVSGLPEMTMEMWVKNNSGSNIITEWLALGPEDGTEEMFRIGVTSAKAFDFFARDHAANTYEFSGGAFPPSVWTYLVATITDNYLRLYVNAVQVATMNWSSYFGNIDETGATFKINETTNLRNYSYDEVAFYRHGLSAARIQAHYQTASQGFARNQRPGERISAILDQAGNKAPRNIQAGSSPAAGQPKRVRAVFFHAQPPLDEIRRTVTTETPDGVAFVAADGTFTFLDDSHNDNPPYSIVQATFGDEGHAGTIAYGNVDVDYSDSFFVNIWNVTATDGTVQTRRDQDSIDRYDESEQSLSDVPVTSDYYAALIADQLVYRYSKPQMRVISLDCVAQEPETSFDVLPLELMDRVRLVRTIPHGLGWIDRQLFIEKIEIQGANDGTPWAFRFGVTDAAFVLQDITPQFADFNALAAAFSNFNEMRVTPH